MQRGTEHEQLNTCEQAEANERLKNRWAKRIHGESSFRESQLNLGKFSATTADEPDYKFET